MNYLFARLREPSTWSGIGIIATLVGVPTSTLGLVQQVVAGLVAICAPDAAKAP